MSVQPDDSDIWVNALVRGTLRSLPGQGQGLQRLPVYYDRIKQGVINTAASLEIVSRGPSVALVDAHDGIGHVMAARAMWLAMELAAESGIGAAGVRHSTHFGVAAHYAMLALEHDFIGLASSNAGPEIAPWGGTRATVGTNPWAVAVPTGQGWPVVLDMANSTSGKGMIRWLLREGKRLPPDWALTVDGRRTDDPAEGMEGTLFPLGGPKGYAMAVIVDALTGVLTGSAFGLDCFGLDRQDVGHLMMALDISRFMPVTEFRRRMDELIAQIRSSPLAPGSEGIFLPGELEHRREVERRRHGAPIENGQLAELRALGEELGLETRLPEPVAA
jgi:LDH2 family malate/lactate/ureidoglycolate dehydrogenase